MNGLEISQTAPHTWDVADGGGRLCTVIRDGDGLWGIVDPKGLDRIGYEGLDQAIAAARASGQFGDFPQTGGRS